MPRTVVPEEEKRVADISALKQIFPTDNRVVDVVSDPDGQFTPYYWDPNGEASNADGIEIIESGITEFADGGAEEGVWRKGQRDLSVLDSLVPDGVSLQEIDGTDGATAKIGLPDGSLTKNEVFGNGADEKGAIGPTGASVSGDLNPQVSGGDNFGADTFDEATKGTLRLVVNGSDLVTIDLTSSTSSITNSTGNGSELSVSASSPLTFTNGDTFEDIQQRTGSWTVDQGDLTAGENTVKVIHEDGTGNTIGQSQELSYYVDDDTSDVNFSGESLGSLNLDPTKELSGVAYHEGGDVTYSVNIDNVYRNTYAQGNAISFSTGGNSNVSSVSIPELGGSEDESKQITLSETANITSNRLIGESLSVTAEVQDDIDTNAPFTSSGVTDFDLLIDQVGAGNQALLHRYNDENYRLAPGANFEEDLGNGSYDSTQSIADGNPPYDTQLQVTEGKVVYPSVDYSTISNGPTGNPNYSGGNTTGQRTYYGVFTDPLAVSNFVFEINGSATLVSEGNATTGDEIAISIKAPTQTGWMDLNENFVPGSTADGDGAYQETNANSPSQSVGPNSEIGATIGTKSTTDSFDLLYYRFTVPANWTGEITEMSVNWGAN
jgi:hypothetical protein